ncbi:hypothetical protein GCM10025857_13700 [Alicyclobacillus contaminans]|uniref:hypothetical protein n=1 Tax=Alicyclobacillus contaminans TaxID=392016 RepID=UPI00047A9AD6|nr:hypothetical protein [Alicyclobacillus contaminans]GMA50013.1 hypothetical protein GCM10025857_13700 [Alicyclobacillus contaminans]
MMRRIWTVSMVCSLALTGCSIGSRPAPKSNDYTVSFSLDNRSPFLTAPKEQYQAQFNVHVSKWNQDYNKKNCEVFLIVTDKTASVVDLETDNANNFAYGGWFNLNVENPALKSLDLQPISTQGVPNNWFNVVNGTQATARFIARTNKPVAPTDWRFVILAIQYDGGNVKVLWTKVVAD